MPTNPAECKGILSGAEKSCRVSRNPGGCQETLPGAMESCRVPWNPAGCHGILPGTMESCLVPRCSRFVTIHVGGTSKGGRGDVGGTLGGGAGGRWGDGGTTRGRQRPYTRSIEDITLTSLRRYNVDDLRCHSQ